MAEIPKIIHKAALYLSLTTAAAVGISQGCRFLGDLSAAVKPQNIPNPSILPQSDIFYHDLKRNLEVALTKDGNFLGLSQLKNRFVYARRNPEDAKAAQLWVTSTNNEPFFSIFEITGLPGEEYFFHNVSPFLNKLSIVFKSEIGFRLSLYNSVSNEIFDLPATIEPELNTSEFTWSQDSTQLVFVGYDRSKGPGIRDVSTRQLYSINVENNTWSVLPGGMRNYQQPFFTTDGYLVYVREVVPGDFSQNEFVVADKHGVVLRTFHPNDSAVNDCNVFTPNLKSDYITIACTSGHSTVEYTKTPQEIILSK
jgi:dipeptidyl aminopeptidase/acylaminoacyl peptidase